jgi:putative spermidine/putrescine transport system ATP-binding protein
MKPGVPPDRAAKPIVSFQGVGKSYDGVTAALHDLSLDLARGERLTVLGPAGAGKTTILRLLAGLDTPSRGAILLDGRDAAGVAPARRGIGMVFRHSALFAHLSLAENVAFPLRVRRVGRTERARRVAAALGAMRLDGLADRRPAQLSGGEQQRAALARALVFEPKLLLLDEPFAALEPDLRQDIQQDVRHLQQRLGLSTICVTSDQSEALALSDRIAVLHRGRLQQQAAPRLLYEQPANAFVARFIGENNRLPGRVAAVEDDLAEIDLDCGARVWARLMDAGPGERCLLAIRPERVAVVAADALTLRDGAMGESAIPAQLIEAIYQGDHLRLRLSLGNDCEMTVKRPAAAGLGALAAGRGAAVAWQPDHALAFRPES